MKKIFRYLVFAAALASCGSDEAVLGGGEQSEGGRPLEFIATMEGMQTRSAEVKTAWADGDVIGVKISTDAGKTGLYSLNADGTVKKAIASVSWPASGKSDITAWYPFSKDNVKNKSIADQSGGYAEIDFLGAELKGKEFAEGVTVELPFKHLMTKVQCKLVAGDGITADDISGATVEFSGATYVTFSEGKVSGSSYYSVKPYKSSDGIYSALLVPHTDKEGYKFITVTVGGNKYYYKPAGGVNLKAGKQYNYKIKVKKTGLEVTGCSITDWTSSTESGNATSSEVYYLDANGAYHVHDYLGLMVWANDPDVLNKSCTLEADITMPEVPEGESNWTAIGYNYSHSYSGTFDGNGHTIYNLTINKSGSDYQGFIGYMKENSTVKNLTLSNAKIIGKIYVGGIAGDCTKGTISNCHLSKGCIVIGDRLVGGIAGDCFYGSIKACYTLCTVSGNSNTGSIAGSLYKGTVDACYSLFVGKSDNPSTSKLIGGVSSGSYNANYWALASGADDIESVEGATMVDGTTVTWATATEAMNAKLGNSYEYKYEQQDGENNPPVLVKK